MSVNAEKQQEEGLATPQSPEAPTPTSSNEPSKPIRPPLNERRTVSKTGAQLIHWDDDDPEHPFNWSLGRKWFALGVALLFNSSTAMNATGYTTAQQVGAAEFNTSETVWLTGTTAYLVPVALTPLVLAPLSEIHGRRPLYLIALFLYTMMFIPQALAPNIGAILGSRIVQGCAGSVGNTMCAGSVADLFPKSQRAIPMGFFVLIVFMSQGIGSTASGWTVQTIGWRWIFWWQGAVALGSLAIMLAFMEETREGVLLSKRAQRISKEQGIKHMTEDEEERKSFILMASRNLGRPILFFVTEPIVAFLALWIGFLWGVVFLSLEGVSDTFMVYGWDAALINTVLLAIPVGGLIGFLTNLHQAKLYDRAAERAGGKAPAEARLYWSMPGAVFTVGGLFWYGWGGQADVHPAVPILGLVLFSWGTYIIYLATLNYISDSYETYASSGIACQALLRNIFGGTFGLFAHGMYRNLSPPIASTVLACISAFLGIAPFVLFFFGPHLRARSRIHKRLMREEDERREKSHG
ncbi:MFS general substrate transporter [Ceraceosorus guamensis]|uniref:MFS general substrate transporter n=1 Tax=Ceraceosorus guamensis TaxID=1522189 RepID=A0A316VPT1_9BASI|nr:MFS general substrate transporter [Ceraceosorus guamensis]PWN39586.1 MFS general substrate transporter [Ceraceosorus guamensis]